MSLALCFSTPSFAEQAAKQTTVVSHAFLEYLAELAEVNGELVHPSELKHSSEMTKLENIPVKTITTSKNKKQPVEDKEDDQ